MVVQAGEQPSVQSREALQNLCKNYWYPLYAFARRKGLRHADAEEVTQGFLRTCSSAIDCKWPIKAKGDFGHFCYGRWKIS